MFVLLLTAIAATVYLAGPRIGFHLAGRPRPERASWLPVAATAVFAAAWFLPPVQVSAGSNTFLLHAVGGGVSATLISYYIAVNLEVAGAMLRALMAVAVVSMLGVANEIFELLYDRFVGTNLTHDSAADLAANTIGAFAAVLVCELALLTRSTRQS